MRWFQRHIMAKVVPAPIGWVVRAVNRSLADLPLGTTGRYLERQFRDARLRAVLTLNRTGIVGGQVL
jgi:hypothetical protein